MNIAQALTAMVGELKTMNLRLAEISANTKVNADETKIIADELKKSEAVGIEVTPAKPVDRPPA